MKENKSLENVSLEEEEVVQAAPAVEDTETPLDKNVRLMSPTRMLLRRFFRSKLSVAGIINTLCLQCLLRPLQHGWYPSGQHLLR